MNRSPWTAVYRTQKRDKPGADAPGRRSRRHLKLPRQSCRRLQGQERKHARGGCSWIPTLPCRVTLYFTVLPSAAERGRDNR